MARSLRHKYQRHHPEWPRSVAEAVSEISEINDMLDTGGWDRDERSWLYLRRKKLQRYINDEGYRDQVKVKMEVDGSRTTPRVEMEEKREGEEG